jgi:citrate lyase subunit beta/citryl-CoA lyase
MLEKATGLGADGVIFDLEDAVPAREKEGARQMLGAFLAGRGVVGEAATFVRVNGLSSGHLEADLREVVQPSLRGVCLPKASTAADIHRLSLLLKEAEQASGLPWGSVGIIPLIETAKGVINAYQIAGASPRVLAIALGAEDLTLDLGVERSAEGLELLYSRSHLVIAARAAGIPAIDAIYPDLSDEEGLIREARLGRQLGFQGKLVIHPKQVDPVNAAFSPSPEEIAQARRIVQAFQTAQSAGSGVVLLDGKMVDMPVVARARRILEVSGE